MIKDKNVLKKGVFLIGGKTNAQGSDLSDFGGYGIV
jgi:hypothetical protein